MIKNYIKHECCPKKDKPLPADIDCFQSDLQREYERLLWRHKCMSSKRKRIIRLARPRCIFARYLPKCPCEFKKTIEIMHLDDVLHTRTEQLSYPPFRKLMAHRKEFIKYLTPDQADFFTHLMRKSLLSVYSRLGNVQPPVAPVPKHKWDAAEWKQHRKYLWKLAKPKKLKQPLKMPKISMHFDSLTRYKTLAIPKYRQEDEKPKWVLTTELKYYQASERILKLAKPKTFDNSLLFSPLPWPVSDNAKKYKASERILALSTAPDKRNAAPDDFKENPYGVMPNALKAKASHRTEELAEPKEYENTTIRENPFVVNPKALKGKATPRLIELAQPKGS